jgi:hypothetical protein
LLRLSVVALIGVLAAVVEIAKTVEARLKLLGPEELVARKVAARSKSTPTKMRFDIAIPLRSAEATAVSIVGVRLDQRDARINFATRALAFNVSAPIILAEAEAEAAIIEPNGLRCRDAGRSRDDDCGQDEP